MKWLLLACALACPRLAMAQPLLVPRQDVTVLYRLAGAASDQIPGGAPGGVRLAWDAAGQRLRAEPLGRPFYALADLGRRVADLVFAQQGSYIEARIMPGDLQALLAGRDARFTRRGAGRLLGLDCTEWAIHSRKLDGAGCVTADGLVLRAEGAIDGRPGSLVAQSVAFGPASPGSFALPEGYFRLPLGGQ